MYQVDQIVKELESASELLSLREFPTNASLHVAWALQSVRTLAAWLGPVDGGISKATNPPDYVGQPLWLLDIPGHVSLECPRCHSQVECEVEVNDAQNRYDGTRSASAEIECSDFCEDCGRQLCPKCPRFPHPDDEGLIRCEGCHKSATEPAMGATS